MVPQAPTSRPRGQIAGSADVMDRDGGIVPDQPNGIDTSTETLSTMPANAIDLEASGRTPMARTLSRDDIEKLQLIVSANSGIAGKLLGRVLVARFGEVQRDGHAGPEAGTATEPATYYEALTGIPDPMRSFFVTARRVMNIISWIVALGLPLALVTLGIVAGESPETIVVLGLAGLLIGMLVRHTFPRTPFG
jgi:hypothetical protein